MKKEKKSTERNRNHVFEEKFRIDDMGDKLRFTEELLELNAVSARFNVTVGNIYIILHVYCRTDHSKSYRLCKLFFYEEI